jgi:hypothetical protein
VSRIGSLDCRSFEDRIHQLLDDRLTLTGDDLLMAHAARCAECEKILNDYESVDDSVKLLPAELAEILRESEVKLVSPTFASRRLVLLASLAAMIVISLNIFHGLDHDRTNGLSPVAKRALAPQLAVASHQAVKPDQLVSSQSAQPKKRHTPDSSPFSPDFSFSNSIPSIPTVPSWGEISQTLDPLAPVLNYSSRIPAVRPVHCSLNVTINWLKHSLLKPERKPDLGFWIDPNMLAAV